MSYIFNRGLYCNTGIIGDNCKMLRHKFAITNVELRKVKVARLYQRIHNIFNPSEDTMNMVYTINELKYQDIEGFTVNDKKCMIDYLLVS